MAQPKMRIGAGPPHSVAGRQRRRGPQRTATPVVLSGLGTDSLVVLITETPIRAEAVAEQIKSATLFEGQKLRGLEYVIDENSVWVRFHLSQYQESGSNKLKDYKVEIESSASSIETRASDLSNAKYARSVKLVAAITR